MSNDIQKYRYLIENIILDESFKDAERIFTDVNGNQKEVSSYIDLFKELAKRNKIQGMEKDISRWIKAGWEEFKEFVDSKKEVQSKSEVKSIQKKDSIRVYQDEKKIVVIPLTKEASIQYGKNTKWCTVATESKNFFVDYFYAKKITLFYVLFKDGVKYACAFHPDQPNDIEYFDQEDNAITYNGFSNATGISKNDIHGWYGSSKGVIMKSQDINNLDEEAQIEIVKDEGIAIRQIKNPSEALQLAAVQNDGYAVGGIDNPSEEVQLAAVSDDGSAIGGIDNPSEEVQLAAVSDDGSAIYYIIKKGIEPSEKVQLAAVKQNVDTIQYIKNPSEAAQLAAVNRDGHAIRFIKNPTEKVQLAAVQQHGFAIGSIIKKGISPSEEVQLAAVQNCDYAIHYIDNPGEKVKALHNKLYK